MNRDNLKLPTARSWRDIPQPVVPRAMSRGGKWRFVMAALKAVVIISVLAGVGWGVWLVSASLRKNVVGSKAALVKPPELRSDGVLDERWLARRLELPPKATLIELDLDLLRSRLLADDQVVSAHLTRSFPDRLIVKITERSPVARVMTQWQGQQRPLLVARDGVLYEGTNYHPAIIDSLPWLDGIAIETEGGRIKPIKGMVTVSELLAKARLEAEHLYSTWGVVSLSRLDSDKKLEVRTKDERYVVFFSATEDYFRQLAKLDLIATDYVSGMLAKNPALKATIDLSLPPSQYGHGHDVPISMVEDKVLAARAAEKAAAEAASTVTPRAEPAGQSISEKALFALPPTPSRKSKSEF